ncbi:origin of replication complex subunit 5 [Gracilaria domingensis]|nr:origin of replication complex subunit 5 [Gracilaria domingensis]
MVNGSAEQRSRLQKVKSIISSPYPRTIFVHGSSAASNFETIYETLSTTCQAVHIDCVLNYTDGRLYSAILGETVPADSSILISRLNKSHDDSIVYVFSRAERLISSAFSPSAVHTIVSLPSLTANVKVRVILVSRLSWSSFRFHLNHSIPEPVEIFLPPPTEDETIEDLCKLMDYDKTANPEMAERLYPGYVKAVVSVMYKTTTDLHELSIVCNKLFPDYMKAVQEKNPTAAFNQIQNRLAVALQSLYRRRLTSRDLDEDDQSIQTPELVPDFANKSNHHEGYDCSLSTTSRTVLVAAFLASRNPPQHDLRFFSSDRTRRRRSSKAKRLQQQDRSFVFERLLAIFASIAPDSLIRERGVDATDSVSACVSTSLLVQVSTLVSLGLLSSETGADILSEPKYRCNITKDAAFRIADSLNIGLDQYLFVE